MAVTVNPEVSSMWWNEVTAFGKALDETLDEMGKATVAYFTDDRREFQDLTYAKFSSAYPTLAAVGRQDQDHASPTFSAHLAALTNEGTENTVRNFGTLIYFLGRFGDDTINTARGGGKLFSNESAEEKALVVASLCGLTAEIASLFLVGLSPKLPITFTTTTIPADISMTMGAAGGRGAMTPALAMSVSRVAVPAVSAEGSAAVAGVLTGPTVMYSSADSPYAVHDLNETPEGIIDITARGLHDRYRANFKRMSKKPYYWQQVQKGDIAFENAPEMYRRIAEYKDGAGRLYKSYEVDVANLEYDQLPAFIKNLYQTRAKLLIKKSTLFGRMWDGIKVFLKI